MISTKEQIVLDTQARQATFNGRKASLGPKECALLELFLSHPDRVWTYDAIVDSVWDREAVPTHSCIRTHIKYLRKAFRDIDYPVEVVENIRGLGYRLRMPPPDVQTVRPSLSALQKLFQAKAIEYLVLDNNWLLRYLSPGAARYSDYPSQARVGQTVWDSFPEFVGLEAIFRAVAVGAADGFEMKGIGRRRNPQRPEYINFSAIADGESQSANHLFVFFEDVSSNMLARQQLVQSANEITLFLERLQAI